MFVNANIPWLGKTDPTKKLIESSIKLGFDGIVLNYNHNEDGNQEPLDTNHECPISLVDLGDVKTSISENNVMKHYSSGKPKFKQYKRLTVHMTNQKHTSSLTQGNTSRYEEYDIVSAMPYDEKSFAHCCEVSPVDIITIDISKRFPFKFAFKTAQVAISRGIFFEIDLATAFFPKQIFARTNAISNAKKIIEVTKGKNVILSLGVKDSIGLRGPYDIINYATLLGIEAGDAKRCISTNVESVLSHSKARNNLQAAASLVSSKPKEPKVPKPPNSKQRRNIRNNQNSNKKPKFNNNNNNNNNDNMNTTDDNVVVTKNEIEEETKLN